MPALLFHHLVRHSRQVHLVTPKTLATHIHSVHSFLSMPPQLGHEHSEKINPQARTKSPQIHVSFKPSDGNQVLSVSGVKQTPRCEHEKDHSYGDGTVTVPYVSLPSSPMTVEQNSTHRQRYTNRPELVANRLGQNFCAAGCSPTQPAP